MPPMVLAIARPSIEIIRKGYPCISAIPYSTYATKTIKDKELSAKFSTTPAVRSSSRIARPLANTSEAVRKPKLIIFDKDGTLICFHSIWIPWAEATAKRIEKDVGAPFANVIFDTLGFCPIEKKLRSGLLTQATMPEIAEQLNLVVQNNGYSSPQIQQTIAECCFDEDFRTNTSIDEVTNLATLFQNLRDNHVKIAIFTADNRNSTIRMLEKFSLSRFVDMIVCGDDAGSKPKPNPHNAIDICNKLGVLPEDAAMVGDTLDDMMVGQNGGIGTVVGVLSGISEENRLAPYAHVVVDHVGHLSEVFDIISE